MISSLGLANSNFINSTVNIRFEHPPQYSTLEYPNNSFYNAKETDGQLRIRHFQNPNNLPNSNFIQICTK